LWARAGRTHCPGCDRHIVPDTVQSATDRVAALPEGTRLLVTFPLPRSARITHETVLENLRALGFLRVIANGELLDLDDPVMETAAPVDLAAAGELLIVGDRLIMRGDMRERIADSLGTAFHEGDGEVIVVTQP